MNKRKKVFTSSPTKRNNKSKVWVKFQCHPEDKEYMESQAKKYKMNFVDYLMYACGRYEIIINTHNGLTTVNDNVLKLQREIELTKKYFSETTNWLELILKLVAPKEKTSYFRRFCKSIKKWYVKVTNKSTAHDAPVIKKEEQKQVTDYAQAAESNKDETVVAFEYACGMLLVLKIFKNVGEASDYYGMDYQLILAQCVHPSSLATLKQSCTYFMYERYYKEQLIPEMSKGIVAFAYEYHRKGERIIATRYFTNLMDAARMTDCSFGYIIEQCQMEYELKEAYWDQVKGAYLFFMFEEDFEKIYANR